MGQSGQRGHIDVNLRKSLSASTKLSRQQVEDSNLVRIGEIEQFDLLLLCIHGQTQQTDWSVAPSVGVEPLGRVKILKKRLILACPKKWHINNLEICVVIATIPGPIRISKLLHKV